MAKKVKFIFGRPLVWGTLLVPPPPGH